MFTSCCATRVSSEVFYFGACLGWRSRGGALHRFQAQMFDSIIGLPLQTCLLCPQILYIWGSKLCVANNHKIKYSLFQTDLGCHATLPWVLSCKCSCTTWWNRQATACHLRPHPSPSRPRHGSQRVAESLIFLESYHKNITSHSSLVLKSPGSHIRNSTAC